ncbi:glycoside hydrolase family 79 protein [Coprinellus micaceus]|uniref:Glycoside hydrolase family 79 protein n=1 Tax=Coprinellus micaceus TaxID=71717 RepID=A0A4Y7TJ19_COPMI|nr:glycoside hydrolase family 79 protein [Coprinellus micaceus]
MHLPRAPSSPWLPLLSLLLLLSSTHTALGAVTTYGLVPAAHQTTAIPDGSAPQATLAAYDGTVLTPPAPPQPALGPDLRLPEQPRDAGAVQGLSIPHRGGAGFYGFSVEMSVITQTIGKNSTHIFPAFLNLMANIIERSGSVLVRLGGNTQEYAKFHDGLFEDGRITQKEDSGSLQTTETPAVLYTIDLFRMMANISDLIPVKWFLGLPFNDTSTFHLDIAEHGQEILGDNLVALQAGNEPDLYGPHQKRVTPYLPENYNQELESLFTTVDANERISNKFVAPSVSHSNPDWALDNIWSTGFIDRFASRLYALTVERYLDNNCFVNFGTGTERIPQDVFPNYLTHQTHVELLSDYLGTSALAQQANLPFIMFETNTASCGGFAGVSQSFGAAMWILDYGMQMAYSNFSNALLHVGGQNVFYNPWISPPTNQSAFNEWTVGSVFYSAMIMAEAFGKQESRIVDLQVGSPLTPAYAIYEGNTLSKFALFNYVDDRSGANDLLVALTVTGGVPASVKVKYFLAESVASKRDMTWAGQTFGNNFEADGRLKGDLNVTTVNCDVTNNVCGIPLRAPSFALVFMDGSSSDSQSVPTATFATTARTKGHNTATVPPEVLATSNGHAGKERQNLGSTSRGSVSGAERSAVVGFVAVVVSAVVGAWAVVRS